MHKTGFLRAIFNYGQFWGIKTVFRTNECYFNNLITVISIQI